MCSSLQRGNGMRIWTSSSMYLLCCTVPSSFHGRAREHRGFRNTDNNSIRLQGIIIQNYYNSVQKENLTVPYSYMLLPYQNKLSLIWSKHCPNHSDTLEYKMNMFAYMNCARKWPDLPDMCSKAERDVCMSFNYEAWPMWRNHLAFTWTANIWTETWTRQNGGRRAIQGHTLKRVGHLCVSSVSTNDKNRLFGCRHA
jgi:hypothetical protein